MKRRDFSLHSLRLAAGAGLGLALGPVVQAQPAQIAPVEGKDFVKLQTPVPVNLPGPTKKIEVIEFFSYSCPHCFAFEQLLDPWSKQVAADVYFRVMPFAFFGPPAQQKMFYALEELGQREALHRKLFSHIHVQKKTLNTDDEIAAFVVANGVDAAKYAEATKSFSVNTKMSRGKQISNGYKIDSVPTMGIQGRFFTAPSLAGSPERALMVVDSLIQRVRQGG
jgi:protein dithiol oxidoreductase (disulfide-forming)